MDSEEPPNVRVACSGDIDEVVRLMHDAAAWMSAKGTPAWDVARIDRTFAETFVLRSELLVASCSDGIVGCCTLSAEDPEFWPDALKGEAAYLHKLAVRRTHAGRVVQPAPDSSISEVICTNLDYAQYSCGLCCKNREA
jgi:hypothetical protein